MEQHSNSNSLYKAAKWPSQTALPVDTSPTYLGQLQRGKTKPQTNMKLKDRMGK